MSVRLFAASITLVFALTTFAFVAGVQLGSVQAEREAELWKRDANMWLDKLDKCEGWP